MDNGETRGTHYSISKETAKRYPQEGIKKGTPSQIGYKNSTDTKSGYVRKRYKVESSVRLTIGEILKQDTIQGRVLPRGRDRSKVAKGVTNGWLGRNALTKNLPIPRESIRQRLKNPNKPQPYPLLKYTTQKKPLQHTQGNPRGRTSSCLPLCLGPAKRKGIGWLKY